MTRSVSPGILNTPSVFNAPRANNPLPRKGRIMGIFAWGYAGACRDMISSKVDPKGERRKAPS